MVVDVLLEKLDVAVVMSSAERFAESSIQSIIKCRTRIKNDKMYSRLSSKSA